MSKEFDAAKGAKFDANGELESKSARVGEAAENEAAENEAAKNEAVRSGEASRQGQIVQMFNQIAPTYDRANRVLSFGVDNSWRKAAAKAVLDALLSGGGSAKSSLCVADVACGTGDMISVWLNEAAGRGVKECQVTGIDPSLQMLLVAKTKFETLAAQNAAQNAQNSAQNAAEKGAGECIFNAGGVKLVCAYADNTFAKDGEFDALSITYGIRNVVALKEALAEFFRVLKSGGRLVVLEFTRRQKRGFVGALRDFYLAKILPRVGGLISRNRKAYEYLPQSIDNFLDSQEFCAALEEAGFEVEVCKAFSFGVSTMFVAKKP